MSTPVLNYFLNVGDKSYAVGTTKPFYSRQKQGWVTDAGIFSTKNPSDYAVSGTSSQVTAEAAVAAPVPATVTPVQPEA